MQRLSQEEGINLSGIKRILELELAERRSRLLLAEMQAEVSQLRAELESTRAVAARLSGLLRSKADNAALVPVRGPGRAHPPAGPGGATNPGQAVAAAADVQTRPAGNPASSS